MTLRKIYAQLNCSDLEASKRWFAGLFARAPDATPMEGLLEWHHGHEAGFQLFRNPASAGKGTLTLIVDDLKDEWDRLEQACLKPGAVENANYVRLIRLTDPNGNLVVLAEPKKL
jgi:hypothetical protein